MMYKIIEYLKLIRVKHYIKNVLIFLPLLFSGNFFKVDLFIQCLIAFVAFCFTASIIYVINDIVDRKKDRLHEVKKNRPLARGSVSIKEAIILVIILLLGILFIMFYLKNLYSLLLVGLYLVINILYSFIFKNIPIMDIAILTSGFIIRVLYGGVSVSVEVSSWLCLTVMAISFYLSLGKRRNEIIRMKSKKNTREVLKYYTKSYLDKFMYLCLSLTIVFYSLWTTTNTNSKHNDLLIWTVPLVILICMKYSMIIEGDSDGDPVEVILKDKVLFLLILIYGCIIVGLFYL